MDNEREELRAPDFDPIIEREKKEMQVVERPRISLFGVGEADNCCTAVDIS